MRLRICGLLMLLLPMLAAAPSKLTLEGEVVDSSSGTPLSDARVRLQLGDTEPVFAKVDKAGKFVVGDLSPGSYLCTVQSPGFLESRTFINVNGGRGIATYSGQGANGEVPAPVIDRTVDAAGVIHVTAKFALVAYATISGQVTDPDGVPLKASIEIRSSDGVTSQVDTTGNGEFRSQPLVPGEYVLAASKGSSAWQRGFRVTYYPAAMDASSAQRLQLSPRQNRRADIRIQSVSGVKVSGHIYTPPGNGTERYFTRLLLEPLNTKLLNPDSPLLVVQDAYEFPDVLPGRYLLSAQTQISAIEFRDQKPVFGARREVDVGPTGLVGLDLNMQPFRSVPGSIEFGSGCAPAPVTVTLSGSSRLGWGTFSAISGKDNRFVIPAPEVGVYRVSVYADDRFLDLRQATRGTASALEVGLESPLKGDEPLLLKVECRDARRFQ